VYRWWVFVHLVGVFGFLAAHGVSMAVMFRVRRERDPQRVNELLQLSASSITAFYYSLGILLLGGIVAGFLGHWWSQAWIWAAIAILVLVSVAMYAMARPYYRRVRFVARAMADGSQAVTEEQFAGVLQGPRPGWIAGIGGVGLLAILYMMMFKPSFGISTGAAATAPPVPEGKPMVQITGRNNQFDTKSLRAPADQAFTIVFRNSDPGVPHNVAVYTDSSATKRVFIGKIFTGPATMNYALKALPADVYFFRCDVHPFMNGTLDVVATSPSPTPTS
jgi:Cupredoxin-like domain